MAELMHHTVHGGGGGIRTPVTLTGQTVFKTAGFNRSPTPPRTECLQLEYSLRSFATTNAACTALRHELPPTKVLCSAVHAR